MEESVFPDGAVAPVLEENYVEARVHVDYPEFLELEKEMADSVSQPVYLIIDPETREILGREEGVSLPGTFREFLLRPVGGLKDRVGALEDD